MRRTILFAAVLALLMVGCGGFPPRVEVVQVGDIQVIEHIDTDDAPAACGDRQGWAGCYGRIAGVHHVWRSSLVANHTVLHEHGHAQGMRHGPWETDFIGRKCTKITASGGHYVAGKTLCVGPRGETIY